MTTVSGKVSVVIPSRNEGEYLPYTVHWILLNSIGQDFEVVLVDDGSTDDSVARVVERFGSGGKVRVIAGEERGPGRARNLGAAEARGESVVFIDAHCYTPPGWLGPLVAPLRDPGIGLVGCAFADLHRPHVPCGAGCTWADATLELVWLPQRGDAVYPVPLLPGGCQAMRRSDFLSFGQYDKGMSHIGSEGEEQALRCWLMGFSVVVQPRVIVHHRFRDRPPYAVQAGKLIYNRLRTAALHFSEARITRVFDALRWSPHFPEEMVALLGSDAMERRAELSARRRVDDDWFFRRFGIDL